MNSRTEIADLFTRQDTLKKLPWPQQEALANLISERVLLFETKLRRSPYIPLQSSFDHLRVNSSFGSAVLSWMSQFPLDAQLGALALALSASYITDREMDIFLDSCVAELIEQRLERIRDDEPNQEVVPYALSDRTDIFGKFVHAIRQPGTSNATFKTPGPLENFLLRAAQTAYYEAADQSLPGKDYYDLGILLDALLNKHYVIIEDWALTGSTMAAEIQHLLRLLRLLFGRTEVLERIRNIEYSTPTVTIVLPIATRAALNRIEQAFATTIPGFGVKPRIITGFIFEAENRLGGGCTLAALQRFSECAPKIKWREQAIRACDEFASAAHAYWSAAEQKHSWFGETPSRDAFKYGYGKFGWAIIGFSNCPDNSLPAFWLPYLKPDGSEYTPLFPRVVSKNIVEGTGNSIREWFTVAEADPKGLLHQEVMKVLESRAHAA